MGWDLFPALLEAGQVGAGRETGVFFEHAVEGRLGAEATIAGNGQQGEAAVVTGGKALFEGLDR